MRHFFIGAVVVGFLVGPPAAYPEKTETNLVPDASFEALAGQEGAFPTNWVFYTSKTNGMGITAESKRTGNQCLKFKTQNLPSASQGLLMTLPVVPGEKYTFAAYVMNSKADPLQGVLKGFLAIEWKDNQKKEISRSRSGEWDSHLSRMNWTSFSIRNARVPKGAVQAFFGVHLDEGAQGAQGSMLLDDVSIEK